MWRRCGEREGGLRGGGVGRTGNREAWKESEVDFKALIEMPSHVGSTKKSLLVLQAPRPKNQQLSTGQSQYWCIMTPINLFCRL